MLQTIGDVGVLGLIDAMIACIKMNVSTTVIGTDNLLSVRGGINTEAIPVKATNSIGTIRL